MQIYVHDRESQDAPLNPVLAGFERIGLDAGQSREITLSLDPRAFTVVGEDGIRRPGSGKWTVFAGFGQPDPKTEALYGKKCLEQSIRA